MAEQTHTMLRYFDSINLNYTVNKGGWYDYEIAYFQYIASSGTLDVSVHYNKDCSVFSVTAMNQTTLNAEHYQEVLWLANKANMRSKFSFMIVGDIIEEEGKFYTWCSCSNAADSGPGDMAIDAMIRNTCDMVETYYPAIMKINWGEKTGKEALASLYPDDDDDGSVSPPPIDGYQ